VECVIWGEKMTKNCKFLTFDTQKLAPTKNARQKCTSIDIVILESDM
jgi:hypothetical protein